MNHKKIIASFIIISFLSSFGTSYADNISDLKTSFINLYSSFENYKIKFESLQKENELLKKQIEELSSKINSLSTNTGSSIIVSTGSISTNTGNIINNKPSSIEKYNKIIEKINLISNKIFSEYSMNSGSTIGLFEFIEPSNFFISIDDGVNPSSVTAFKKKILYSYDKDFNFVVTGVFDLDYKTGYYITKFGKNPFAATTRIRIKNPVYKGKLLDNTINSSSSNAINTSISSPISISNTSSNSKEITFEMIKEAYTNNKILDTLKYSDEYIKKDPNNIDILRMRYRSFHMLGRYSDALSEIQKIEALQGSNLLKVVACDGSIIARLAKNTDLNTKYSAICKK